MRNWMMFLGGVGLGARIMYMLDPGRGKKRRTMTRDRALRRARRSGRYLKVSARDLEHRVIGVIARRRSRLPLIGRRVVSDGVLAERVRSKLGRYVSHPHAIVLDVRSGHVTLGGPILRREVRPALRAVRKVPGVRGVSDRFNVHRKADLVALQGGEPRAGERWDVFQDSWAPATRLLAGLGGTLALVYPAFQRKGLGGGEPNRSRLMLGGTGFLLLARALSNRNLRELFGFGRRRLSRIHKTITIRASVDQVFSFWSDFRNFPKFMDDIYEVRVSDDGLRSYWKMAGPGGAPLSFESRVTRFEPNRVIAWKSTKSSVIPNAGKVVFNEVPEGARLDIEISYLPPGGELAEAAARVFGADPKSRMDHSLAEVKTLLEKGPSERQLRRLI